MSKSVTSCPKALVEPRMNRTVPITIAVNLKASNTFVRVRPR